MNSESKTVVLQARVTPTYQARYAKACSSFGIAKTEMLLYGVNLQLVELWAKYVGKLDGIRTEMRDGPKREALDHTIETARVELKFFTDAFNTVKENADSLREIQGIEAYRDFLRSEVNEEVPEPSGT